MSIHHDKVAIEREFQQAYSLHRANRATDAKRIYEQVIARDPRHLNSLHLLGLLHLDAGELNLAKKHLGKANSIAPKNEGVLFSLGNLERANGNSELAITRFQQALEIRPDYAEALHNLSVIHLEHGRSVAAMETVLRNLELSESPECQAMFCGCLQAIDISQYSQQQIELIEKYTVRALDNCWTRPASLVPAGLSLLSRNRPIAKFVEDCVQNWPNLTPAQDARDVLIEFTENELLLKLLISTSIPSAGFEKALTNLRSLLLTLSAVPRDSSAFLELTGALAQQCYINEYVFSISDAEKTRSEELRAELSAALTEDRTFSPLSLLMAAMYFPLHQISSSHKLLEFDLPLAVQSILRQQVEEPIEESRWMDTITTLTPIENSVSVAVRDQYEQNPYPRWVRTARLSKAGSIFAFLQRMYRWAPIEHAELSNPPAILIAGCGTGQQPIGTSQRFPEAKIVAVDLSARSLCYAQRKSVEAGTRNIEFAQADILQLGKHSIGTFDIIESTGVLHHMSDPFEGWSQLVSLLKPGGFMNIGLYSELGRQDVVAVKKLISAQNYGSDGDDIRRCRQELFEENSNQQCSDILKRRDFYSLSSCRDLLFHECEHRFDLGTIDDFLRSMHLSFVSFQLDSRVFLAYRSRFPDDRQMTNLGNWNIFEKENPETFRGMYQFWIQKR